MNRQPSGVGRLALHFIVALLPQSLKRTAYRRWLGWTIDRSATIGWSLVNVADVRLGPGARIGHFNVFRGLRSIELGQEARIGQWNWFSAVRIDDSSGNDLAGRLILRAHSAMTSRHYVDCSGGLVLGAFSTVGGVKSTILTHQIDMANSKQTTRRVSVGEHSFLSSDVRVTPGAVIGDRIVIGMGAVVVGELTTPNTLYAGAPARPIKEVDGAYFTRSTGFVE